MLAWEVRDGHLRLSEAPVPPAADDERLIRVLYSGVCGSDVWRLRHPEALIPSDGGVWRPGHEIVGWDVGIGSGQLLAVEPLVSCMSCPECGKGDTHLCPSLRRIGWDLPGGFTEVVRVPTKNVVPLPDGVDPAHAVLADPLAVSIHGIDCGLSGATQPGQMAVVGAGSIGVCSAAYASFRGWEVSLVVREPKRVRDIRSALGVSVFAVEVARRSFFDAVIDAASGIDDGPLQLSIDLVRDGGIVVVQTAYLPNVRLMRPLREVFRRSVRIAGSFSFCQRRTPSDFRAALMFLAARPAWADLLTQSQWSLSDLEGALDALSAPDPQRPLKVILTAP